MIQKIEEEIRAEIEKCLKPDFESMVYCAGLFRALVIVKKYIEEEEQKTIDDGK